MGVNQTESDCIEIEWTGYNDVEKTKPECLTKSAHKDIRKMMEPVFLAYHLIYRFKEPGFVHKTYNQVNYHQI